MRTIGTAIYPTYGYENWRNCGIHMGTDRCVHFEAIQQPRGIISCICILFDADLGMRHSGTHIRIPRCPDCIEAFGEQTIDTRIGEGVMRLPQEEILWVQ